MTGNDLTLHLTDAAPQSFALFALGTERVLGSVGTGALCIGGALQRVLPIGFTDGQGHYARTLDLGAPYAGAAMPGTSLFAQAFFRDTAPTGAVLGTSDALQIVFTP